MSQSFVGSRATRCRTRASPLSDASSNAGWREIGGARRYYRSRWEANFARYLEWLRARGKIKAWAHEPECFWFNQPKVVGGRRLTGVRRGCVSYLPDFRVIELSGNHTWYEVKGWMDDRSKTKIARMRLYYPDIQLRVIDSKAYSVLRQQLGGLIPGWEE